MAHVWLHNANAADAGHFGEQTFAQCLLSDTPPATAVVAPSPAPPRRLIFSAAPATDRRYRHSPYQWWSARAPPS